MERKYFLIDDFIKDYPNQSSRDLQEKYGLTEHQVASMAKSMKLKKSRLQRAICCGKKVWTEDEDQFLRDHWHEMNNSALAKALGRKLTNTRTRLYELGMKRIELEYWTDEMVQFLRDNYLQMGDTELAGIFSTKWPKNKGWNKKHIEKKRRYLKLKRTKKEIQVIHQRNVDQGRFLLCPVKRWETTGQAAEGEIRYWRASVNSDRMTPRIKVNGRFVNYSQYRYTQIHGPIPKGYNAIFLDGNPRNIEDSNIGIVSDGELSKLNSIKSSQGLSDNYVAAMLSLTDKELREEIKTNYPELIALKRKQLILNRTINESL